jgi:hypothetical protein
MAFQGTGLADSGIDLMFIMVGQNATQDVKLGKVWSTPGLQGVSLFTSCLSLSHAFVQMFEGLPLSENEVLEAARTRSE